MANLIKVNVTNNDLQNPLIVISNGEKTYEDKAVKRHAYVDATTVAFVAQYDESRDESRVYIHIGITGGALLSVSGTPAELIDLVDLIKRKKLAARRAD